MWDLLVEKRFKDKYIPEPNTGCWLWIANTNDCGYGQFWVNGKNETASRFAYNFYKGEIPRKKLVLHKCDTPACVNPDHLFLGTQLDNMRDMVKKGRNGNRGGHQRRNTHCPLGHEFNNENMYHPPSGKINRMCRACRAIASVKANEKKKSIRGKYV